MKKLLGRILGPKMRGMYRLRHTSALESWGWYRSIEKGFPCDKEGRPVPWISYSAAAILRARVQSDWDIFEFGAGYSTLWWAAHCHSVTSCEHDDVWCKEITQRVPANCTVLHSELNAEYPLAAKHTDKTYDVVVIDGRKRVRCALNSVSCLKEAGVMVWDDTDRDYYRDGLAKLTDLGFKRIDLIGMSPLVPDAKQTSILYRTANVLGI